MKKLLVLVLASLLALSVAGCSHSNENSPADTSAATVAPATDGTEPVSGEASTDAPEVSGVTGTEKVTTPARTYIDDKICSHENAEILFAAPASCESDGNTGDLVCPDCGDVLETGEAIPALGHDVELQDYKEPTAGEGGFSGNQVCKVCGLIVEFGHVIPHE